MSSVLYGLDILQLMLLLLYLLLLLLLLSFFLVIKIEFQCVLNIICGSYVFFHFISLYYFTKQLNQTNKIRNISDILYQCQVQRVVGSDKKLLRCVIIIIIANSSFLFFILFSYFLFLVLVLKKKMYSSLFISS